VYGSCVAAQVQRARVSREAARDQCIAFELLAREAETRGHARDADVVDATRAALVGAMTRGYAHAFARPGDFGDAWSDVVHNRTFEQTVLPRYQRDEYRSSSYVRVVVPTGASAADDAAARAIAERIAAATAGERGMLGEHLLAIATREAGDRQFVPAEVTLRPGTIEWQHLPPYRNGGQGGLEDPYADALFAIPEVGRTSPAVRTTRGWDVILWTGVEPALAPSPDQLATQLVPEAQRAYFARWVGTIARQLGVHVELFDKNVELLDESKLK
jgi:hypothetical protein